MGNQGSAPVAPVAFEPSTIVLFITAVFGFLHALTGCLAMFLEARITPHAPPTRSAEPPRPS